MLLYNKILFALNHTEDSKEYKALQNTFEFYGFTPKDLITVRGCYNDKEEQAYMYPWDSKSREFISALCELHAQESIMTVDGAGEAHLLFLDRVEFKYTRLGVMKEVSMYTACMASSYTELYDENQFRYYIVQED